MRLSAVPDTTGARDAPDEEAELDPLPRPRAAVTDVARRDLARVMSTHPASDTLVEVATLLAETLDAPQTRADPRAVAAVSKELRATLADLVRVEEAGDADPFGLDDMPAPVVVSPAS